MAAPATVCSSSTSPLNSLTPSSSNTHLYLPFVVPFKPSSSCLKPHKRTSISLPRRRTNLRPLCSGTVIEKEIPQSELPSSFLRNGESPSSDSASIRGRFEKMIRETQDRVCAAIEALDGCRFKEDVWSRPGGGGGVSRVLQDGNVWEKAGVNVSVVYGMMPPDAYRAATGEASQNAGPVPFFAAGISSVLHPKNPFAPTLHFNYRYFETDAPEVELKLQLRVSEVRSITSTLSDVWIQMLLELQGNGSLVEALI